MGHLPAVFFVFLNCPLFASANVHCLPTQFVARRSVPSNVSSVFTDLFARVTTINNNLFLSLRVTPCDKESTHIQRTDSRSVLPKYDMKIPTLTSLFRSLSQRKNFLEQYVELFSFLILRASAGHARPTSPSALALCFRPDLSGFRRRMSHQRLFLARFSEQTCALSNLLDTHLLCCLPKDAVHGLPILLLNPTIQRLAQRTPVRIAWRRAPLDPISS